MISRKNGTTLSTAELIANLDRGGLHPREYHLDAKFERAKVLLEMLHAGQFSELQIHEDRVWVALPDAQVDFNGRPQLHRLSPIDADALIDAYRREGVVDVVERVLARSERPRMLNRRRAG